MEKLKKSNKIFEDMLEDDFVNILRIGFSVQRVYGMLGVHLKYKFITPPTRLYKIYSVSIWLMHLICIMYTVLYCSSLFDPLSTDVPLKIGILVNGVTNAGLALKSSFCSGHLKSQLYVKLQRIERTLKMKNAKRLNRKVFLVSSLWAVLAVILYGLWFFLFNNYLMHGFCPTAYVASAASAASFVIIFHIYTILKFIKLRAQYVNEALVQINDFQKGTIYTTTNIATATNVDIGKELLHGTRYILESFADTMDVFQHSIFFFTLQMLAWQLISMQNLVATFKNQITVNIWSILCTLPCSLIFMGLMLTLCFTAQALTNKLESCGELCTSLISSLNEGESRENAKRIRVLLDARRPPSVFDIFTLNTQLPFHLLAITATYTVVLLQFATL